MQPYEKWSLALTGIYDLLTLSLLAVTFYIAVIQRRIPNIAFFYETRPPETDSSGSRVSYLDFVLENRGIELRNVSLTSTPDNIGWATFGGKEEPTALKPKATSEYFKRPYPFLYPNQRKAFFWCDAGANKEILDKPFTITVEFDNPVFVFPRRLKRKFEFDLAPRGIFNPVNGKYDIHNVAQEVARIRENLDKINEKLEHLK